MPAEPRALWDGVATPTAQRFRLIEVADGQTAPPMKIEGGSAGPLRAMAIVRR